MSLKTVNLSQIDLSYANELKLSVRALLDINSTSRSFHSQQDPDLVKALTSGDIWTTRGSRCRIDIHIGLNDLLLHQINHQQIIEAIGSHICSATMWSQLCLSTRLEIPGYSNEGSYGLSIHIHHDLSASPDVSSNPADIRTPNSLLCAQFDKLQLHLEFGHMKRAVRRLKKAKRSPQGSDSPEVMLLDESFRLLGELEDLESLLLDPAQDLPSPPQSSQAVPSVGGTENPKSLPIPSTQTHPNHSGDAVISHSNGVQPKINGKRLPKLITDKLAAWLDSNLENPYPTVQQRKELLEQTGLHKGQLGRWFSRNRLIRGLSTKTSGQEEMLLSSGIDIGEANGTLPLHDPEEAMLLQHQGSEDDMLLSPQTQDVPSLTSLSSRLSTVSLSPPLPPAKHPRGSDAEEPELRSIDIISATALVSQAFGLLISGSRRRIHDVRLDNTPQVSLSEITPSMFSPGFSAAMAQHSRFLPTLSSAICSSWIRNVQSPSLRSKVMALSGLKASEYGETSSVHDKEVPTEQRLAEVLQCHLWSMMQRKLFDSAAARKLQCIPSDAGPKLADEGEDCELLFEELYQGHNSGGIKKEPLMAGNLVDFIGEEFPDDEEDDDLFEDLLSAEDDEGLLEYMERQEELALERETDEMLVGSGENVLENVVGDDEDEDLLLEVDNEMLLL